MATSEVVLIAGGDVEWSRMICLSPILFEYSPPEPDRWPATPRVRARLSEAEELQWADRSDSHRNASLTYDLSKVPPSALLSYPFSRIGDLFRSADIGFVNLEMPLSARGRQVGDFKGDPAFASTLREAGITIVSLANNHILDAEGRGLSDTLSALREASIVTIGAGRSLRWAQHPRFISFDAVRLAFLAYSQIPGEQNGTSFATAERSGIAPLDPTLVCEGVRCAKARSTSVVVSLHWGREGAASVHAEARALGHRILEAGADLILGHHSHVPQPIERVGDKYIVYSMGNCVFGHSHEDWGDNFLVRAAFTSNGVKELSIIPIAGQGADLACPYVLPELRAKRLLRSLKKGCKRFNTDIDTMGARVVATSTAIRGSLLTI